MGKRSVFYGRILRLSSCVIPLSPLLPSSLIFSDISLSPCSQPRTSYPPLTTPSIVKTNDPYTKCQITKKSTPPTGMALRLFRDSTALFFEDQEALCHKETQASEMRRTRYPTVHGWPQCPVLFINAMLLLPPLNRYSLALNPRTHDHTHPLPLTPTPIRSLSRHRLLHPNIPFLDAGRLRR